jgi:hypothetical protein
MATVKNLLDMKAVIDKDLQQMARDLATNNKQLVDANNKLAGECEMLRRELASLRRELGLLKEVQSADHLTLVTQKSGTELALRNSEVEIYNRVVDGISKNVLPKVTAAVNYMNHVNEDPYVAINKYRMNEFADGVGFDVDGMQKSHNSRLFFRDDDIDHGPRNTPSNTRSTHLLQHK